MPQVVILTRQPESYASQRFATLARERPDVGLKLIDPHEFVLYLAQGRPSVSHPHLEADPQDLALVPRLGSLATEYGLAVQEHLEHAGAVTLNPSAGLLRLRNKFGAAVELAQAGLPVPDSAMLRVPSELEPVVESLGGYPVILKFIRGSQGVGVVYAADHTVAQSVLEALNLVQYDVMLQRFYPAAARSDVRVLVLGGSARWAVRRTARPEHFRANFHRGGTYAPEELNPELKTLAERAASWFSLGLAGVDLIESPAGWLVLEVNGSPGFETIERTYGADVALEIVEQARGLLSHSG